MYRILILMLLKRSLHYPEEKLADFSFIDCSLNTLPLNYYHELRDQHLSDQEDNYSELAGDRESSFVIYESSIFCPAKDRDHQKHFTDSNRRDHSVGIWYLDSGV